MAGTIFHILSEFFTNVLATAVALAFVVLFLILIKAQGPIEPVELLKDLISRLFKTREVVNVELRGPSGEVIDFGHFVHGRLRTGRGESYRLRQGCFERCDPKQVTVGANVTVSLQDGFVMLALVVQLDWNKQILFVESEFTQKELLDLIHHKRLSEVRAYVHKSFK